MWTADTGPGRLCSVDSKMAEEWEAWAESMMRRGVILLGLLPNSTSVLAVLDELFRAFKIAIRKATQRVYAKKIKTNARSVRRKKLEIAERMARNEEVPSSKLAKVNIETSLNPGDLGKILYGK